MSERAIVEWAGVGSGALALVTLGYLVLNGADPWISLLIAGVLGVIIFLVTYVVLAAGYLKS